MKNFRLQPGHWFSGGILFLLLLFLYRPTVEAPRTPLKQNESQITVTEYRVVENSENQWLEPIRGNLPRSTEPMAGALNLMAQLDRRESPLPPGTRALSVHVKEQGVAWADFNRALVANFPGGSAREALLLEAILRTLGQFPGVHSVQITVEGEVIESIGGHADISEPQPIPPDSASSS